MQLTIVSLIAWGTAATLAIAKTGMNRRRDMCIKQHPEVHPKRIPLRLIVTNRSVGDVSYPTDSIGHDVTSAFAGVVALGTQFQKGCRTRRRAFQLPSEGEVFLF